MPRSFDEERAFLEHVGGVRWKIKKGFVPNMNVDGILYVNSRLEKLVFEELRNACRPGGFGGFLPAVKQIANVAALPGIVGRLLVCNPSHRLGAEASLHHSYFNDLNVAIL